VSVFYNISINASIAHKYSFFHFFSLRKKKSFLQYSKACQWETEKGEVKTHFNTTLTDLITEIIIEAKRELYMTKPISDRGKEYFLLKVVKE